MYEESVHIDRLEHTVSLFGSFDENIRLLERTFRISIVTRGSEIRISGEEDDVKRAVRVINAMLAVLNRGDTLNEQSVRYCISLVEDGSDSLWQNLPDECVCITAKGKPIKPKTIGQSQYVKAIAGHSITFGVGPAGTGKTYLAVAMAVAALRRGEVDRIILTRPAVTMRCTICWGRRATSDISNAAPSRSRRWPICADARSMTALLFWTRRRIPPANK